MFRSFLAVLVLAGLVAGFYYWRLHPRGFRSAALEDVGAELRDTKTTAAVKTAFRLNRRLKPYPLDVTTEAGVVTVRGELPGAEVKAVAEKVAAAAQVKLALSLRRELQGADFQVQVFRRQVTLSGEVASVAQGRLAVEVAQDTAEVAGVDHKLRVRGAEAGDRRAAAERALTERTNLRGYGLRVDEESGRLVLRGRVRTGAERDLAGLLAREAAGIPVENAIEIKF